MGKSNGVDDVTKFDKDLVHTLIENAISQLSTSGVAARGQKRLLYRMCMVGVMAAYTSLGEKIPPAVRKAIVDGTPLKQ